MAENAAVIKLRRVSRVSGQNDPDGLLKRLGDAIRAARIDQEISQEALADFSGIDRSHLGKIERGERNLTLLNFQKIASALRMPMSELIACTED